MRLSESAYAFRTRVIEGLDQNAPGGFGYGTADDFSHTCPVCGGLLVGHFHGFAAAVDLTCLDHDCAEPEIAAALRKVVA
jgi:hypothetical protein